ncbi:MAG: biotin transporter BioY [Clostridiales bacterium]|nr:biotin transporter BioY [Clostridiales bacterium]
MKSGVKKEKKKAVDNRKIAFCGLFAALIAVGAKITIPGPIVPFTVQFLFVNLAGVLLGKRGGMLSVGIYVALGLLGLPVFANGGGGIGYVLNPRFGYLIGFFAGSYAAGAVSEYLKNRFADKTKTVVKGLVSGNLKENDAEFSACGSVFENGKGQFHGMSETAACGSSSEGLKEKFNGNTEFFESGSVWENVNEESENGKKNELNVSGSENTKGEFTANGAKGTFFSRVKKFTPLPYLIAGIVCLLIVYFFGVLYFYLVSRLYLGSEKGLWFFVVNCFLVFVPTDFMWCVAAAFAAKRLFPIMKRTMYYGN